MNAFAITQWRAWAPGLESAADWQRWALDPQRLPDHGEQPGCDFLPAMQRRRLSRMARMCMDVAWPLCGDDEQLPFVFGSRHGETTRTFAMLGDVVAAQPLSPTQFGLSVHNAIAGQWSILRGQRGESVAIAGETDTFEHAMLEGALLLVDAPAAIVVVSEEKPPSAYADWIDDVPFSHAMALRLEVPGAGNAGSPRWQLGLAANDDRPESAAPPAWPHALGFLRAMLTAQDALHTHGRSRQWHWQRRP
jgi:hypothetical protein